jgi:CBS domain containing-hemolysin-like protein
MPEALLHPIAFSVSLVIVAIAHILLGEMVPKNIAISGPERTATWLVPPFLLFTTAMRPVIGLFNMMANGVLRLIGVEPRDELEAAFTSGELADLIAESGREGLLDDDESSRIERTLRSADATVADVLVRTADLVTLPATPTVGDVAAVVNDTGYSRFPVLAADGWFAGYLHVKDDSEAEVPAERVRTLPTVPVTARLDSALAELRRSRAHLGRAISADGATVGLVTMEDLIEHYVGSERDTARKRRRR